MFASLSIGGRVSVWQLNASAYKYVPEVIKVHTLRTFQPRLHAITIWGNKTIQVMGPTECETHILAIRKVG